MSANLFKPNYSRLWLDELGQDTTRHGAVGMFHIDPPPLRKSMKIVPKVEVDYWITPGDPEM